MSDLDPGREGGKKSNPLPLTGLQHKVLYYEPPTRLAQQRRHCEEIRRHHHHFPRRHKGFFRQSLPAVKCQAAEAFDTLDLIQLSSSAVENLETLMRIELIINSFVRLNLPVVFSPSPATLTLES